jgi:FkbM family methyltransferase
MPRLAAIPRTTVPFHISRLPSPPRLVKFLAALATPWRPAFRTTARASGLRFWVQPRDAVGRHIAKYGRYEPALTAWIDGHLRQAQAGLFIDIGANLGWHTVHAARCPAVTQVVAFEPDALNAWLLARNLADNAITNAVVLATAVGAASGIATLYRYKASNQGRHSLATDHGHGARRVPLTDLDTALAQLGLAEAPIALIKIDVEGYEPAVIAGAAASLGRTAALATENSPELAGGDRAPLDAMLEKLNEAGFMPHRLGDHGRLSPLSLDDLRGIATQTDIVWLKALASA